jgi:hypothetical protein
LIFFFLHFSRSNQGVFKDFSVFKGFSSALENEFQIPGVFKELHESWEGYVTHTLLSTASVSIQLWRSSLPSQRRRRVWTEQYVLSLLQVSKKISKQ